MTRWLVVMAKAPRAYAVKSRLAREVGAAEATRFYRTTLASLVRRLGADPRWTLVLAVAPDTAMHDPIWPPGIPIAGQGGGNLGQRMQRIMDRLPPGPAIIIGSDIPGIRPHHVCEAFSLLGRNDIVFGPAVDGGFWLVGMKRRPVVPRVFDKVRWSSPSALSDTLDNCAGLDVALAARLSDVDGADDWRRWRREC